MEIKKKIIAKAQIVPCKIYIYIVNQNKDIIATFFHILRRYILRLYMGEKVSTHIKIEWLAQEHATRQRNLQHIHRQLKVILLKYCNIFCVKAFAFRKSPEITNNAGNNINRINMCIRS